MWTKWLIYDSPFLLLLNHHLLLFSSSSFFLLQLELYCCFTSNPLPYPPTPITIRMYIPSRVAWKNNIFSTKDSYQHGLNFGHTGPCCRCDWTDRSRMWVCDGESEVSFKVALSSENNEKYSNVHFY